MSIFGGVPAIMVGGSYEAPKPTAEDYKQWAAECEAFAQARIGADLFEACCFTPDGRKKFLASARLEHLLEILDKATGKNFVLRRGLAVDYTAFVAEMDNAVEAWATGERGIAVMRDKDGLFTPLDMSRMMGGDQWLKRRFCTRLEAVLYALKLHPEAKFTLVPREPQQLAFLRVNPDARRMQCEPFAQPHDETDISGLSSGDFAARIKATRPGLSEGENEEAIVKLIADAVHEFFKLDEVRVAFKTLLKSAQPVIGALMRKMVAFRTEKKLSATAWASLLDKLSKEDTPPELAEGLAMFQGLRSEIDGFEPWPGYPNLPKSDDEPEEKST